MPVQTNEPVYAGSSILSKRTFSHLNDYTVLVCHDNEYG